MSKDIHERDKAHSSSPLLSQGVEELIHKLRDKGVSAGRQEAEAIVRKAQEQAEKILNEAQDKATKLIEKARKEAEDEQKAARDACELAARDTVLGIRTQLSQRISEDVKRLITRELQQPDMLRKLILIVVGRTAEKIDIEDEAAEILLPRTVLGLDDLRQNPGKLAEDPLTDLVFDLSKDMLKEGVALKPGDGFEGGLRMRLVDKDIEINLTEKPVAELLLEHLQPRFRALLEGIVK